MNTTQKTNSTASFSSLAQLAQLKERGASLFKLGDYLKALNFYEDCLHLLIQREKDIHDLAQKQSELKADDNNLKLTINKLRKEALEQKAIVFNNLAMCHFKRKEIKETQYYNKRCLELDPNYVKAHYRKIQILMQNNKFQKALIHANECLNKYQDKQFAEILHEIQKTLNVDKQIQQKQEQLLQFEQQLDLKIVQNSLDDETVKQYCQYVEMGVIEDEQMKQKITRMIQNQDNDQYTQKVLERMKKLNQLKRDNFTSMITYEQLKELHDQLRTTLVISFLNLTSLNHRPSIDFIVTTLLQSSLLTSDNISPSKQLTLEQILSVLLTILNNTSESQNDHSITHEVYVNLMESLFVIVQSIYSKQEIDQSEEEDQQLNLLLKTQNVIERLFIIYKHIEESDWIFKVIQFQMKMPLTLTKILLISRTYFDFTLTMIEKEIANNVQDILQIKTKDSGSLKLLKFQLYNQLSVSKKGRSILADHLTLTDDQNGFDLTQLIQITLNTNNQDLMIQQLCFIAKMLSDKNTAELNQQLLSKTYKSYLNLLQDHVLPLIQSKTLDLTNSPQVQAQIEVFLDALVYMSLKSNFKQLLLSTYLYPFKIFIQFICTQPTKRDSGLPESLKSSLIFALLNLVRDSDYDILPSFTYSKREQLKDMDISYYELKELQATLGQSKQLYAQLNQDFTNEYGDRLIIDNLRSQLIFDCDILSIIKGLKDYVRLKTGVVIKKWLQRQFYNFHARKNQFHFQFQMYDSHKMTNLKGMIGYLLDLRKMIREQTSEDYNLAIESEINIAQALAKIFINTNPHLIHDHSKYDAISLLVKKLIDDKVHHELLIFEGLMALTNISSLDESFRDKIILEGGWLNAKNFLFDKNLQIIIASIELMSNLALTSTIHSRLSDNHCNIELQAILSWLNQEQENEKMIFAVFTFIANVVENEVVKEKIGQDQSGFVGSLVECMIKSNREDIWHRALYIQYDIGNLKQIT